MKEPNTIAVETFLEVSLLLEKTGQKEMDFRAGRGLLRVCSLGGGRIHLVGWCSDGAHVSRAYECRDESEVDSLREWLAGLFPEAL